MQGPSRKPGKPASVLRSLLGRGGTYFCLALGVGSRPAQIERLVKTMSLLNDE